MVLHICIHISFNRTIVELRHNETLIVSIFSPSFNRTIVELRQSQTFSGKTTEGLVLIEP